LTADRMGCLCAAAKIARGALTTVIVAAAHRGWMAT
jgi:hypothetical protein